MATPGARSGDPIFKAPIRELDPFDNPEFDMSNDAKTEMQQELEKLAGCMTDYFKEQAESELTVSLLSPGQLTVNVPQKGYRKQNHIGGEDFIASSVYVGAQSKLIFKFKPVAAAQYTEMEMNEVDAAAALSGFRTLANLAAGGDFFAELRSIRNLASKAKQAQEVVEKAAVYADFGSW